MEMQKNPFVSALTVHIVRIVILGISHFQNTEVDDYIIGHRLPSRRALSSTGI